MGGTQKPALNAYHYTKNRYICILQRMNFTE